MLTQLNPPLPLETPKGSGWAHFVIDYGPESDLLWVVFLNADGACWAVPNPEIRLAENWTLGRRRQNADASDLGRPAASGEPRPPPPFRPTLAGANKGLT
jgi:hypothetical protein